MALKNFNRVIAETPPEISEMVKQRMDKLEEDELYKFKPNSPGSNYGSILVDTRPKKLKTRFTQEMLDDLNKLWDGIYPSE